MSFLSRINQTFSEIDFSEEEKVRYARHLTMPEVQIEGQKKLKAARVLVVGAGGLGSPVITYLAGAGVGKIGIVDFDRVDLSNLHRQLIHKTSSVGKSKVKSAVEAVREINPHIDVEIFETCLSSENALQIFNDYDVIVDGSDNFPTRYLINDACALLTKPLVYGALFRFEGQASVFWVEKGPCYRCLYPEPPPPGSVPNCAEAGVFGVLPGIVGAIQATEAIKLILGEGTLLTRRMLFFDALKMKFRELILRKDPQCPICSEHPTLTKLIDYEAFCGEKKNTMNNPTSISQVTVQELKIALDEKRDFDLIDVRELNEYQTARIEGSRLIPLSEFQKRIAELDPTREIWLHCKSGMRSGKASQILLGAGYTNVKNVSGGIDAWSREIDPTVPRY